MPADQLEAGVPEYENSEENSEEDYLEPGFPVKNLLGDDADPTVSRVAECVGALVYKEIDLLERLTIADTKIKKLFKTFD